MQTSRSHSTLTPQDCSCERCERKRKFNLYPPDKNIVGKFISRGTFGHVFQHAQHESLAVKYIVPNVCSETTLIEMALMCTIKHPAITPALEIIQRDGNQIYIIMPRAYTNLREFMRTETIPEADSLRWLAQILSALDFMHNLELIHADIKPNNILLFPRDGTQPPYCAGDLDAKLIDFGKTRYHKSRYNTKAVPGAVAPPDYLADNVAWSFSDYAKSIDIWSLACSWVHLNTGHYLYNRERVDQMEIVVQSIAALGNSTPVEQLIRLMLVIKPELRPTAGQMLKHEFLAAYAPKERGKILNIEQAPLTSVEQASITSIPSLHGFDLTPHQWICTVSARIKWAVNELKLVNFGWEQIRRFAVILVYEMQYDVSQFEDNFRKLSKVDRNILFDILDALNYRILKN